MKRNSNFIRKALMGLVAAFGLTIATYSHAIVVQWSPTSTDVTNTDFNTATMLFAGFQANSLDSVSGGTGAAGAWWHSHSAAVMTAFLDLELNGIWTNIFSSGTTSVSQIASNSASSIPATGFASSTVTGIRLRGVPGVNQSFHGWSTSTSAGNTQVAFTFSSVPEPGTLALLGLGMLGAGLVRRRRKA